MTNKLIQEKLEAFDKKFAYWGLYDENREDKFIEVEEFLKSSMEQLISEFLNSEVMQDGKEYHGLTDASLTNNRKIWENNSRIKYQNELRQQIREYFKGEK